MDNVGQYGPALFPTLKQIRDRLELLSGTGRKRSEPRPESETPAREQNASTSSGRRLRAP